MAKKRSSKRDFKKVRLLVLDFDGVMTDNKVYVDEDGREMVCCSRGDGLGTDMVRKKGIAVMVISKERNKVVAQRCNKLGLECRQATDDKLKILKETLKRLKIAPSQVCYVGNDINDIECVGFVGLGCAVKDSHPRLLKIAGYITARKGGDGAVREVCDLITG